VPSDAEDLAARLNRITKLSDDFIAAERTSVEARRLALERRRTAVAANVLIRSPRKRVKPKRRK
jgi:hypothetical protein